jgi:lysophospholipase L1-like esterase
VQPVKAKGKWVWIVSFISIISCLLFAAGLGMSIYNYVSASKVSIREMPKPKQETSSSTKSTKEYTIVALGDSLTRGTGDAAGKGYVGYLKDNLEEKTKKKILLSNFGIKGQVQQQQIQRQIKSADTVLITIGGNDLFQGGQTLQNLNKSNIQKLENDYLKNVDSILKSIRSANKDATIYLIGLYNPFSNLQDAKATTAIVREWNYNSSELSANYKQTVFVPTFDLFQLKVDDYLYTDKFHPNAKGYKLIAERVASLITW